MDRAKLERAVTYIQENLDRNLKLTNPIDELGISYYHLCRLFRQELGVTPHQYIVQQRVERAKTLLEDSGRTILDITNDCGFANPSHFAKCFRERVGISPRQFRSTN
jgi:AraC family transcriptional regulator